MRPERAPSRGFEALWGPAPGDLAMGAGWSPAEIRAKLQRLARGAPEVVVRFGGAITTQRRLGQHLDYISRGGEIEVRGPEGERLLGREDLSDLAADWGLGKTLDASVRASRLAIRVVISSPLPLPRETLTEVTYAFIARSFGAQHDFAFACHFDTAHPHAHIAMRVLSPQAERLNPSAAQLRQMRETFAALLRAKGLEVEATDRAARGVVQRPDSGRPPWLREGQTARRLRIGELAWREARQDACRPPARERPWESALQTRQKLVRETYGAIAEALEQSADPADRALAHEVRAFVAQMPPVVTRHQARVASLRRRHEAEALAAGLTRVDNRQSLQRER